MESTGRFADIAIRIIAASFVAAGFAVSPCNSATSKILSTTVAGLSQPLLHILAQVIGHFLQSMESRGWCRRCCRDDASGRARALFAHPLSALRCLHQASSDQVRRMVDRLATADRASRLRT